MVWEQNCATIVMLTKEKEGGRTKCHKYWPDSGAKTFSHLQVILHAVNEYPDYILREFKIIDTRVSTVIQYNICVLAVYNNFTWLTIFAHVCTHNFLFLSFA